MSFTVLHVSTETNEFEAEPVVTRLAVALRDELCDRPHAWSVQVRPDQSDHLLRLCRSALSAVVDGATVVTHGSPSRFEPLQAQLARIGLGPLEPKSVHDTEVLTECVFPTLGRRRGLGSALAAVGLRGDTSTIAELQPGSDIEALDEVVRVCRLYLALRRRGRELGWEPDMTPTSSVRWGMAFELIPTEESFFGEHREAA